MAITNEELARTMEQANWELEQFGKMTAITADRLRDAKVGVEGFSKAVREAPQQVTKAAGQFAGALYRGEKGAKAFNNSIDSMADAASSAATVISAMIPGGPAVKMVVAGLTKLAQVAIKTGAELQKAAGAQGDALFDTYRKLAESGAAGSDGVSGLAEDARKAGQNILNLGHYASKIAEGSQDLALYAGTVDEGRKRFADVNAELFKSGEKLERLGYNSDAQVTAAMGYMRLQQRMGLAQSQSTENMGKAAVRYIEEQDRLTKVTGISREQQEKSINDAMRNQRYAAAIDMLRDQGNEKAMRQMNVFQELMGKLGPSTQKGFQDMAAGMGLSSEEAAKANMQSGQQLLAAVNRIRSGAVKDDMELAALADQVVKGMANFNKTIGRSSAALGTFDESFGSYAEGRAAEQMQNEGFVKSLEAAIKAVDGQKKGQDDLTKTLANTAQKQRQAMVNEQELMQKAVPLAAANINALATAAELASDKLVKLAGGRGGTTGGGGGASSGPMAAPGSSGNSYGGAAGGPLPGYGRPTEAQAAQLSQIRDLIGRVESDSSGGYNAVVGGGANANLSGMTVGEVQKLQRDLIRQGKGSAVGRYQLIATTFRDVIGKMGIKDDDMFDQNLQDRIADFLIMRSGYSQYLRNPSPEGKERLLSQLAGTWRGLPNRQGVQRGDATDNVGNKAGMGWDQAIQSFARGGIAAMPDSGGLANLHGTEAIVPLPDGRSIPVAMKNELGSMASGGANVDEFVSKLSREISAAVQTAASSITNNMQLQPILMALQDITRYQRENVNVNERMLRNSLG